MGDKDTDTSASTSKIVYNDVLRATTAGIYQKIEDEKSAVRNATAEEGDSIFGWLWKMLKSFIFAIAEAFGFEKQLAGFFGMPIPEDAEVTKAATQVAHTVSHAVTDKNFTYNTKQELQDGLQKRITDDLNTLKGPQGPIPAFTDERIAALALEVAASTANQMSGQFTPNGQLIAQFTELTVLEKGAAGKFATSLTQTIKMLTPDKKEQLAQVTGKKDIGDNDIERLAAALAPTLLELQNRSSQPKESGDAAFTTVTNKIAEVLTQKQNFINGNGMKLNPSGMAVLADYIAIGFMSEQGKNAVPDDFQKLQREHENALVKNQLDEKIPEQIAEGIKTNTAAGTLYFYDKSSVTGFVPSAWGGYPAAVSVRNTFYQKDSTGHYQLKTPIESLSAQDQAALKNAQQELYDFAVKNGYSLTDLQRKEVGRIVADTTSETLADKNNANLDQADLADKLRTNIHKALQAKTAEINALSATNSIATINDKNSDKDWRGKITTQYDVFDEIAKGFAEEVENSAQTFTQLNGAREMLQTPSADKKVSSLAPAMHNALDQFHKGYNPDLPEYQGLATQGKGVARQADRIIHS